LPQVCDGQDTRQDATEHNPGDEVRLIHLLLDDAAEAKRAALPGELNKLD
jgi:hypothetical protein